MKRLTLLQYQGGGIFAFFPCAYNWIRLGRSGGAEAVICEFWDIFAGFDFYLRLSPTGGIQHVGRKFRLLATFQVY
jgi:hypothetical protein